MIWFICNGMSRQANMPSCQISGNSRQQIFRGLYYERIYVAEVPGQKDLNLVFLFPIMFNDLEADQLHCKFTIVSEEDHPGFSLSDF